MATTYQRGRNGHGDPVLARAGKTERQRREGRHFTPDQLGKPCRGGCGLRVVVAVGHDWHPTCRPDAAYEMRRTA